MPKHVAVARIKLLTGRNLEEDRAHLGGALMLNAGWVEEKEKGR